MSKMRHLLRKLHIGGGGGGDQHHHHVDQPVNPQPSGSSSTSSNSSAPAGRAVDSAAVVAAAVPVVPAVPVGTGGVEDFSVFEEEYQVQLALAISASDPDGLEDADAVQMKAAKRMSLGCTDGAAGRGDESLMEFLSLRYWNYNVINYDEKLADGFYDVCGIIPNQQLQAEMPSLIDLQATLLSDSINYVVVLVNRSIDQALQILESRAISISSQCRTAELGPIASGLVQKIADLVVESMGGPVADAEDMSRRWTIKSYELQTYLNSIVLPIGLLEVGLSRHRALLFKVLADRVNLPCRLVKETCYTGTDEGAVNLIKINYDSEFIIDLMGAPGTLIPAEIPSSLFLDSEPSLLSSNITEQSAKDLCLAFDKINCQFEKENEISEARAPIAFPSTTDSQSDEISRASSSLGTSDVSVNQINQTKRYESGFWELLPPSGGLLSDTSRADEAMPPAKQMKINDISKYVFSVDKDPELAQLQSVLLESGTRQNPDAFVDTTHAQEPFVQRNSGTSNFSEGRNSEKENQFPVSSFSLCLPSSLLPSTKAGPLSCADGGNKEQNMVGQIEHNSRRTTNHNTNPPPRGVHSSLETCQAMVPFDPGYNENITELKAKGTCPFSDVALELTNSGRSGTCSSSLHEKPNSSEQQISSVPKAFGTHCFLENKIKENALVKDCQDNLKDFKAHFVGMGSNELAVLSLSDNYRNDQMLNDVAQWEILWEDLQIGERIGLGSCGEVYRADWNGTEVAVKKFLDQDLSGDAVEQFRCEVRIMLRLRHPNVVLFMGAVTRPPNLSILTEFLPRGSLFRLLHRPNVQLDEKRRLRMALDVAKGMNYLHTSHPPIVHRDLKTPNLLVDKNWVVKVCDFGLSKMKHHTFLSSNSTAGTPEWMAPEVLRNEPSNEKSDVYSFGVILWELATLHMPWGGMNPMQVVGAVGFQNRRLDIPKDIDPMVAQIISDCWQSEPHLRPSFAQLMTPLKHLQRLIVN